MENKKVLFVSQKIYPYLPEDEMSMIGRLLPQGIQERGKEIRTFMPRFGSINERRNQLHEVIRLSGMNLIIDETDHPLIIKVASIQSARMQVYFIDNEDYFQRKHLFRDLNEQEFPDNDERAIFFARGVIETVRKLRWSPDIIHCHGWFTALIPLYVKRTYHDDPLFTDSKVIYSIYNERFDKTFNKSFAKKVKAEGITDHDLSVIHDKPDFINVNKLAINMSDAVIQGSAVVDKELIKYAKSKKKLFLTHQKEDKYLEAFSEFYDKILTTKSHASK
jgi:starch synthase